MVTSQKVGLKQALQLALLISLLAGLNHKKVEMSTAVKIFSCISGSLALNALKLHCLKHTPSNIMHFGDQSTDMVEEILGRSDLTGCPICEVEMQDLGVSLH